MTELDSKTQLYLNLYIASGCVASKKVDCFTQVWPERAKNLARSSIEQYCKKIHGKDCTKKFISDRQVSSSVASEQLFNSLTELDELLNKDDLKIPDRLSLMKEKRYTLSEVNKMIVVNKPINSESENHILPAHVFQIIYHKKLDQLTPDEALFILNAYHRKGALISIKADGTIADVSLFPKQEHAKLFKKAMDLGKVQIGINKELLEQEE